MYIMYFKTYITIKFCFLKIVKSVYIISFSIRFPDPSKGQVSIYGALNSVFAAKHQLLGCLPLVLMFDLPDESRKFIREGKNFLSRYIVSDRMYFSTCNIVTVCFHCPHFMSQQHPNYISYCRKYLCVPTFTYQKVI